MADQEDQNLEHAKVLWKALMGIQGLSMEMRMAHLYRMLTIAELLRNAPVMYADPRRGVADVLCQATTKGDEATVTGANSRLRSDCAKCVAGGSRSEFSKNATLLEKKLGFEVGAFDAETSRLCKRMAEELQGEASKPLMNRPYEACAEHAVFEKLDRLNLRPHFTYAVQKKGGDKKQKTTFQVKIVQRCQNCQAAGGEAVQDGEAFGLTPRLGRVVTDHPSLVDLDVPIITPRVLQYFRIILAGYFGEQDEDGDADEVVTDDFPMVRVWADVNMRQHCVVPVLGPTDPHSIQQELAAAGMPDAAPPPPEPGHGGDL